MSQDDFHIRNAAVDSQSWAKRSGSSASAEYKARRHRAAEMSVLAFATLSGFSGVAYSQTSVTLYGVVDAAIEYVNHVGAVPSAANRFDPGPANKAYRMDTGGLSGSRWGLRGSEDLGNDLKAVFVLESGFALDTGAQQQGGRIFGRNAYVGLQSERFGQVSFGRQYTALFDAMANFVPAAYGTLYEPSAILLGPNYREDNTAKYRGTFGPLSASAHWSFGAGLSMPQTTPTGAASGGNGEVPGSFRRDTGYGAGLNYKAGALGFAVGYDQWNPTIGTGNGAFKSAAVAVNYAFGQGKVMAGYRWNQNRSQTGSLLKRDDFYWVGGTYRITPAVELTLEYDYQNVRNVSGNTNVANPWQIAFISTYAFSKRTDVYLTTAFAKDAGLILDSAASGFVSSVALGNSYTLARGESTMLGAAVGIRHKF